VRTATGGFRDALKVHLITDPVVAAERVLGRPGDAVEHYGSVQEARRAPDFFAVRGRRRLNAAIHAGETMTRMVLADPGRGERAD
jgi:hypothetical protein